MQTHSKPRYPLGATSGNSPVGAAPTAPANKSPAAPVRAGKERASVEPARESPLAIVAAAKEGESREGARDAPMELALAHEAQPTRDVLLQFMVEHPELFSPAYWLLVGPKTQAPINAAVRAHFNLEPKASTRPGKLELAKKPAVFPLVAVPGLEQYDAVVLTAGPVNTRAFLRDAATGVLVGQGGGNAAQTRWRASMDAAYEALLPLVLQSYGARITNLESTAKVHGSRLNGHDSRLDGHDELHAQQGEINADVHAKIAELQRQQAKTESKVDGATMMGFDTANVAHAAREEAAAGREEAAAARGDAFAAAETAAEAAAAAESNRVEIKKNKESAKRSNAATDAKFTRRCNSTDAAVDGKADKKDVSHLRANVGSLRSTVVASAAVATPAPAAAPAPTAEVSPPNFIVFSPTPPAVSPFN
jgi:hypothetical protein